ncbi:MAG: hypothetical protein ACO1PW_02405 [Actinomycetota bacterium]
MSGTRFGLLLGLAAVVVAAAAFLVGLRVLEDDGPDRPPSGATSEDETADDGPATDAGSDDSASSTTEAPTVTDGALPSPSWVLVISSEGDGDRARAVAEDVAARGHPSGFLRSDDYPSLNPGFWVAYAGPYPDSAAAAAAEPTFEADGWAAAYVRCVGTTEDCGGPDEGGEPDDGGDDDDG